MRIPNLFIVGAPKCGTTAMRHYLGHHPDIFMAPGPEPHYFASDMKFPWIEQLTEEQYLQLFSDATEEIIVGEKSTSYLVSMLAATEIKAFSPDAKIVAMVRNPVDMLYSLHSESLLQGYETIRDFYQALAAEAKSKNIGSCRRPTEGLNLRADFYRETIKFSEQIQRYFDVFGKERVHVIIFDDLTRDAARVYAETLRFLNVDVNFKPDFKVINQNKRYRSRLIARPPEFARAISRVFLPKSMRQRLRDRLTRLNVVHETRPPLDPRFHTELKAELAPEVERLGRLLGRELSHWSKPA